MAPLATIVLVAGVVLHGADADAGDLYLRAGLGLERSSETVFADRGCMSASPVAFYGCGRGGDGARLRSVGGFGTAPALELGLGSSAAPVLRLEVLAEYCPRLTAFEGRANFPEPGRRQLVEAEMSSLSAMLAPQVDLPALGLPSPKLVRQGPFSPPDVWANDAG